MDGVYLHKSECLDPTYSTFVIITKRGSSHVLDCELVAVPALKNSGTQLTHGLRGATHGSFLLKETTRAMQRI